MTLRNFGEPTAGTGSGTKQRRLARQCWQNAYYAFDRPVGTSLVCIQGEWSNLTDARIKGCLAALATAGAPDHSYSPLHARAFRRRGRGASPRSLPKTPVFTGHWNWTGRFRRNCDATG